MSLGSIRRGWTVLLLTALTAGVTWMCGGLMLRAAGKALVWEDPIRGADVVIVASWDGDAGALQAADLIRQGIAPLAAVVETVPDPADRVLIARGIIAEGDRSWIVSLLHMLGVQHVELVGSAAGSESEAEVAVRWCAVRNVRTAVIVTTPDHSHRLRRNLSRTVSPGKTSFIVIPSRYTAFDPQTWWRTRGGLRTGIVELEKLALDIARHPFG